MRIVYLKFKEEVVINSDAKSTGSGSDISIEHDEMQLEAMTIKSLTRGEGNGAKDFG